MQHHLNAPCKKLEGDTNTAMTYSCSKLQARSMWGWGGVGCLSRYQRTALIPTITDAKVPTVCGSPE